MEQLALILHLQWLLFKNSLRSQTSKIELIARIIFAIGSAVVDIFIAVALFSVTLTLSNHTNAAKGFVFLFVGITLYWQVIPLINASFGGALSISNFRLYPISDKKLLLLDLISGATDLISISVYLPLLGILIASIILSPLYSPIIIVIFALYILFNVALSRYLQRIAEILFAHRRIKEVLVFLSLIAILAISFAPILLFREGIQRTDQALTNQQAISSSPTKKFSLKENLPSSDTVVKVLRWSPPGLVARSINFAKEPLGNKLTIIFLSALFFVSILALVQRRIKQEFYVGSYQPLSTDKIIDTKNKPNTDEVLGKSIFDNSLFNLLPLHAILVFEKEIKYFYRSSKILLILFAGTITPLSFVFLFQIGAPPEVSPFFKPFLLPGLNFYALMVVVQLFTNSFGFDSHGAKTFFLMPIKGKNVLLGKNLAIALVILIQTIAITILFHYLISFVTLYVLVNTFLTAMISCLAYITLGNFLSVFYPQKVNLTSLTGDTYSKMALLLVLLLQGFVFSFLAIAPIAVWYYKAFWVVFPVFAVELVGMLIVYKISLKYVGAFFEKRAEEFLQTLL